MPLLEKVCYGSELSGFKKTPTVSSEFSLCFLFVDRGTCEFSAAAPVTFAWHFHSSIMDSNLTVRELLLL